MNFSERPPSKQWAALKFQGEPFAEVRFKPEGRPFALAFRIAPSSFQIPGIGDLLTTENLLRAVGIAPEEVESCRLEGASLSDAGGSDSEFRNPLPPPLPDAAHLNLYVLLKPPPEAAVSDEEGEREIPEARWQDLEARWKAILELEAIIDTHRISMEGVRAEMETSSKRMLTPDEKVHALNADVGQWNKAKSRVHYTLPKAKEFIHRSTWAAGAPERKRMEELIKSHIRPRIPFPEMDRTAGQLEILLKDRQSMAALGASVYQECRSVAADVQGALRNLQSNAAANAAKQRAATISRGKFY